MLGAGSWQVCTVSPMRAAALPLIRTVLLPPMMVPLLVGGTVNAVPGGVGRCGGLLLAALPMVAAGLPPIFTLVLRFSASGPANVCGSGVGTGAPGGVGTNTMCMSVAMIWSPCFLSLIHI